MEFYSYISHLLKLEDANFTRSHLDRMVGTGGSTQNYVIGMERIGLVEKTNQNNGVIHYWIKDPKVVYALENNLKIEK